MAYVDVLSITNATSEGLIVASNASVPEASARVVYVLEGGVAADPTVSTGGNIYASNGGLVSDGVASAGAITARNGGTVSNVNIEGDARAFVYSGGVWSGGVISGTGENDNYDTLGGGIMRGVTVKAGTVVGARFAGNLADTIRVEGGGLHIQRGGSGANITQVGGNVYVSGSGNARSYVSGLFVQGGTCALNALADVENVQVTGGKLNISAVKVKDLSVSDAGSFTLAVAGYYLFGNVNFAAGTLTNDADAHAENGVIYDLNLGMNGYYGHGITLSNYTHTGGTCYVIDDAVVDGGTVTAGTMQALNNVSANGAVIKNVTFTGGTMIVRGETNRIESSIFKNGTFYIQSNAQGADLTIEGGTFNCASGSLTGGTITGGTVNFNNGFTVSNVTMTGGTANANATLTMKNTQLLGLNITGGTVNVNSNSILNDANITAGTVNVNNTGILDGCDVSGTGKVTLAGGFWLKGDLDFVAGQLTNDADAYAVDGTIHDLNMGILAYFGHGVTLSNYTQTANAGNLVDDAVADGGTVLSGGSFQILNNNGANGAVIRNFVYDGTGDNLIVRGVNNLVESTTLRNGAYHIQSGGAAHDLKLSGGVLSATGNDNAHSYVDGITVTGGTIIVGSNADVKDVSITGTGAMTLGGGFGLFGDVNFEAGMLTNDADAYAANGTIYNFDPGTYGFLGHGVTLSNFTKAAAGNLNLIDDAVADGGTVTAGTLQALNNNGADGAEMKNVTLNGGTIIIRGETNSGNNFTVTAGTMYVQSGASAATVTLNGGTLSVESAGSIVDGIQYTAGTLYINSGTTIKNLDKVAAGETNLRGNAVVDGGKVSAGYLQALANAGTPAVNAVIKNVSVTGGAIIVRGETNRAENITISAGTMHVQTNATADGVEVLDGASVQNSNNNFAGAVVSNLTLRTGAAGTFTNTTSGAQIVKLTMEDGATLKISSGAVSGGTVAGGTLNFTNVNISGLSMAGGTLNANGNVYASAATITNLNQTAGTVRFYDGSVLEGGVMIGTVRASSGATINGLTVSGLFYVSSGAVANDVILSDRPDNTHRFYVSAGGRANRSIVRGGEFYVYGAEGDGLADELTVSGGLAIIRYAGNSAQDVVVSGGALHVQQGASASIVDVQGGALYVSGSGGGVVAYADLVRVSGGKVSVNDHAVISNINMTGGNVSVLSGGVVSAVAGNTLYNVLTSAGAKVCFVKDGDHATLVGANTQIAEGTLWYEGTTQLTGHGTGGVISGLGAGTAAYKLSIGNDIVLKNAVGNNTEVRISCFDGAKIDGMVMSAGAIIGRLGDSVEFDNVTLSAGHGSTCNLNLSGGGQTATNTVIGGSGAKLQIFAADAKIENTTIKAGGSMNLAVDGADTGKLVTLDFTGTGGDQFVNITNLNRLAADTEIVLSGWTANNTYTLTTGAATSRTVRCYDWGLYQDTVRGGATYTNAFDGISYDFTNGKAIAITVFDIGAAKATAGTITTSDTALNGNQHAAKWNSDTQYSGSVTLADGNLSGDVWLQIDGTNVSSALYGATKEFDDGINIHVENGQIRNLAAGSRDGDGTVANVKLTLETAHVEGTAYAAGFGSVAGKAETLITGGTYAKDFYAGALDNYANGAGVKGSQVGEVALTITAGDFAGNIYGASAVKVGSYTSTELVHSVANGVNITVEGGEATKADFCMFAGGYATGSNADALVYRVDGGVSAAISGGTWGEARGGRGIFGGAFASGVKAEVDDVDITISGGTFGNVYGGGWAQKGGTSTVGDVGITISGGTIANVFGGGSHSVTAPGGATIANDVTITVSGGTISGDIFARGQLEGDIVANAQVIFTGAEDFYCGVWGYSYVGGVESNATLNFTAYSGTFHGEIGGFDSIKFDGDTAMELFIPAEVVSNNAWEFDFTDRADTLAGTAFLTWDYADFAGDTVKVTFADETQAKAGWSIADAAFDATTSFNLVVGATDITVAYDTAISGGDYDGWKFTSVDGTLKFANLA